MTPQLPYAALKQVFARFAEIEPEPNGELEHVNAFTLLVAVALSARGRLKEADALAGGYWLRQPAPGSRAAIATGLLVTLAMAILGPEGGLTALGIAALVLLVILGVPVAFASAFVGIIGISYIRNPSVGEGLAGMIA